MVLRIELELYLYKYITSRLIFVAMTNLSIL